MSARVHRTAVPDVRPTPTATDGPRFPVGSRVVIDRGTHTPGRSGDVVAVYDDDRCVMVGTKSEWRHVDQLVEDRPRKRGGRWT